MGKVEPELVDIPGNVSTRDATRRLWSVVHEASWLYFFVRHGRPAAVGVTAASIVAILSSSHSSNLGI